MNRRSRPSLVFGDKPVLLWNVVNDATVYSFTLVEKDKPENVLFEITIEELVSNEARYRQLSEGNGSPPNPRTRRALTNGIYAVCDYPPDVGGLARGITYQFKATNNGSAGDSLETDLILASPSTDDKLIALQRQIVDIFGVSAPFTRTYNEALNALLFTDDNEDQRSSTFTQDELLSSCKEMGKVLFLTPPPPYWANPYIWTLYY